MERNGGGVGSFILLLSFICHLSPEVAPDARTKYELHFKNDHISINKKDI